MYERFTDRARKVMALANQEAGKCGEGFVEPYHILMGLLLECSGVAASVLKNLGFITDKTEGAVKAKLIRDRFGEMLEGKSKEKAKEGDLFSTRLPFTPLTNGVIDQSIAAAIELNNNYVGTEHILIALCSLIGTKEVLAEFGVTREKVIEESKNLLGMRIEKQMTCKDEPKQEGGFILHWNNVFIAIPARAFEYCREPVFSQDGKTRIATKYIFTMKDEVPQEKEAESCSTLNSLLEVFITAGIVLGESKVLGSYAMIPVENFKRLKEAWDRVPPISPQTPPASPGPETA